MIDNLLSLLNPEFQSYFQGPLLYLFLLFAGLSVGIISGLFGVGGGFLLIPLMNVFLGIPYEISVGSGLASSFGTTSMGFKNHLKKGSVSYPIILLISCGTLAGVIMGDSFQDWLKKLSDNPEDFTVLMHISYLVLLVTISVIMIAQPKTGTKVFKKKSVKIGPTISFGDEQDVSLFWLLLLGLLVGVLAALLGIGGGFFLFPLLILILGLKAHEAVRTSLGIVVIASFFSIIKKGFSAVPKISLPVTLALLTSSILGVRIGAWLCEKFHGEKLKKYFSFVILLAFLLVLTDLLRRVLV